MTQRPKVRDCDHRVWHGCQSTVLGPVFLGDPGACPFLGWGWRPQSGSSRGDLTRGGQRRPDTPAREQVSTHNHLQEPSVRSPVPGAQCLEPRSRV